MINRRNGARQIAPYRRSRVHSWLTEEPEAIASFKDGKGGLPPLPLPRAFLARVGT